MLLHLLLRSVDQSISLHYSCLEYVVVQHVCFHLINRDLNKHTGNLWSSLMWNQVADVFEDSLSNLVLQEWISISAWWKNLLNGYRKSLLEWHLLTHLHVLTWHLVLVWSWWHSHDWWWGHLLLLLLWLWHIVLRLWHTTLHLLIHMLLSSSLMVLTSWTSSGVLVITSIVISSMTTTSHSIFLHHWIVHLTTVLHDLKELLENLGHVWVRNKIVQMESTCL